MSGIGRRVVLVVSASLALPARSVSQIELDQAIRSWARAPVTEGRVKLAIEPLVDNGNAVPVAVTVDSPMTPADHVREIVIFNEKNPQREVARFDLSPASGRAAVATRIRLARSQKVVALARMGDGSCWSHTVDVIVTLAACIES